MTDMLERENTLERKDLIQEILPLEADALLGTVQDLKTAGYRLGQVCATPAEDDLEVLYSFEKDNVLKNYKLLVGAAAPELQSITAIYPYAFIYENEMHDLFGITFKNLSLDYGGKFFKVAKSTPWNPKFEGGEA
ncbi:MAG: NADH-quinone oxidoreductase subunit C [Clostridiales Family XIII bacterium]|jgi:ech hydrogenase subunit D|nr:NADH-quinone oxidoreductase subunit C [Clostridiales Family XIII bacterium]